MEKFINIRLEGPFTKDSNGDEFPAMIMLGHGDGVICYHPTKIDPPEEPSRCADHIVQEEICAELDKIDNEVAMVCGVIGDRVQRSTREIRRKLSA